jgi:hypothetical protein
MFTPPRKTWPIVRSLRLAIILFLITCAPTVYSPHAQNEMMSPFYQTGNGSEIGGGFTMNAWVVDQNPDTQYIRIYPAASANLFYNTNITKGRFSAFSNIEGIGAPVQWLIDDGSGLVLWLRLSIGLQYSGSIITCRLNLTPLDFYMSSSGDWESLFGFGLPWDITRWTILLHNKQPSNPVYWTGIRKSPSALGLVGGYEHSFSQDYSLRAEYSYLIPAPYSFILTDTDLASVVGSVHYLTLGFFKRMK